MMHAYIVLNLIFILSAMDFKNQHLFRLVTSTQYLYFGMNVLIHYEIVLCNME